MGAARSRGLPCLGKVQPDAKGRPRHCSAYSSGGVQRGLAFSIGFTSRSVS